MIPVTLTAKGSAMERLFGSGSAALGDPRIETARAILRETAQERRAVSFALRADRARGLADLDALGNRAHRAFQAAVENASRRSPLAGLRYALDSAVATSEPEYMDQDDVDESVRRRLIEDLATFNKLVRAYSTFTRLLVPHIDAAATRSPGRPVRVLELGSGHGDLALHLARWAARSGTPIDILGSDIAPDYVRIGEERARKLGLPVRYQRLNAFDLDLETGSIDLVFNTQCLHHFEPGQIARIFAEATRVGGSAAFIDGERSLRVLAAVYGLTRAVFSRVMHHDAVVSCRKFLDHSELLLLASLGPAGSRARVTSRFPGYSVVTFPAHA